MMDALNKLRSGMALVSILAVTLAAPAFADKISAEGKNPPINSTAPAAPPPLEEPSAPPPPPVPDTPPAASDIDFGDDSSQWAKDGECDDPRFAGTGSAAELVDTDIRKDATDCKAALEAGTVTIKDVPAETGTKPADIPIASPIDAINWGDDSSEYAKDNECDDARFTGRGMGAEPLESNNLKDATDCKAAYAAGTITLRPSTPPAEAPPEAPADAPAGSPPPSTAPDWPADIPAADAIDFGDDTSEWNKDGECDDPRFKGQGSADELVDADVLKDATDCRTAYEAGTVTLNPDYQAAAPADQSAINYGDDTSKWAKDEECDDPRFSGTGVAGELAEEDRGHDATDCRAAVQAGTAIFNGDNSPIPAAAPAAFDYGTDSSKWANDGECDDLRFTGTGVDKKLLSDDLNGDATDCKAAVDAGTASIRPVYAPEYAAGAPYDSTGIDFGDNTSDYADDESCDDPRFEGPGAASILLEDDLKRDSNDCKAGFEGGKIVLKEGAEG